MRTSTAEQRHHTTVTKVAETYRRRGYDVVVEPPASDVPAFLQPYQPDLVARKGDERIIIEVALPSSKKGRGFWSSLAQKIREEPGWHFRIFIAGDEPAMGHSLPSYDEIEARLAEAEKLVDQGHTAAALMFAWSMFEAAARLRMMDDDRDPAGPATTTSLVQSLAYFGYFDQEEAAKLDAAAKLRNAVAHGALGVDLTPDTIRTLMEATRRLLHQEQGERRDAAAASRADG